MFQGTLPQRSQAAFGPCRPSLAGPWSLGGQAADAATRSTQTADRDQWVRNMSSILYLVTNDCLDVTPKLSRPALLAAGAGDFPFLTCSNTGGGSRRSPPFAYCSKESSWT